MFSIGEASFVDVSAGDKYLGLSGRSSLPAGGGGESVTLRALLVQSRKPHALFCSLRTLYQQARARRLQLTELPTNAHLQACLSSFHATVHMERG